jgi:UDP-N-acetyl-D-mannosaminuronic acid dehydrogenase
MAAHILEAARARWPHALYSAYDPVVPHAEFEQFGVEVERTLEDAFAHASLILIQNNHKSFQGMPVAALMQKMAPQGLVYDYWNLFDPSGITPTNGSMYVGLGSSSHIATA